MSDGPCYYCNEPTESNAGNPGLWPVLLCHPDKPGKAKHHHVQCVSERLAEIERLRAEVEELKATLQETKYWKFQTLILTPRAKEVPGE